MNFVKLGIVWLIWAQAVMASPKGPAHIPVRKEEDEEYDSFRENSWHEPSINNGIISCS